MEGIFSAELKLVGQDGLNVGLFRIGRMVLGVRV